MRHLILLFLSIILLSSCRKDKREFTSDFPNGYVTNVFIDYYESTNRTFVSMSFVVPGPNDYYQSRTILLPPECYLKLNGIEISAQTGYTYYEHNVEGKPICEIEFLDHDGTIYKNTLFPPDTAYFTNLPDTISSLVDMELQINPTLIDSNEYTSICLDGCSYDNGDWVYFGTDSIFTPNSYTTLESGSTHVLYLYRTKHLSNPNLPLGGGSISYRYIADRTFYVP